LFNWPSAAANTIRHRNARAWADLGRRAHRCSVSRSSSLSSIAAVGRPRRCAIAAPIVADDNDNTSTTPKIPTNYELTTLGGLQRHRAGRAFRRWPDRAPSPPARQPRLNHALHLAAICQIRQPHGEGRAYFERKLAESKTKKDAIRSLKRHIINTVYRQLIIDAALAMAFSRAAQLSGLASEESLSCRPSRRISTSVACCWQR
jgi:hypothetical protein